MTLNKFKIYLLITTLYCLPFIVNAQQQPLNIKGVVCKRGNTERLAQAVITDLKTRVVMMSDELGGFNIKTAVGDTLLFSKIGFADQKQLVAGPEDIFIYMQPVIELDQVNIKDKSTMQELNDVVNTYRSKGLYFDGKPPALLFNPFGGSPITGLYELFSRDAKNERHFIKFSKDEMEAAGIRKRYNPQLVKHVTALPDSDVVKFMQQYTPSADDIKQWNDYELITHIKQYLEYFKVHKNDMPMEKLY
ncbi:hypothetical protein SAMN05216490_0087 [Mucilaginibacter mallensis]|uniref:CarboxypepD_reg-like domain-containing protein n=1 Tax=Mucilaginibacter mallensis TaxID=652787 RepID=A0A1H1MIA9_MUCMA|nr:hypothetical protein [Mucilaginibacter mallensis]SDR86523.1 hypothetical protein SAMN05216490_0087 [Mucilaginibacter mallensis]